jgi:hypothetical protein
VRAIDFAHAADAENVQDLVGSLLPVREGGARRRSGVAPQQRGGRSFEKRFVFVVGEKRLDFKSERLVSGAGGVQERVALGGLPRERGVQEPVDEDPALVFHSGLRLPASRGVRLA